MAGKRRPIPNPAYIRTCSNPDPEPYGSHKQLVSEGDTCKSCGAPMKPAPIEEQDDKPSA